MDTILHGDHAQRFLIPHLRRTEQLFRAALHEFDSGANCQIIPAADLCFPHDVIRIAGGFATGCLVDWTCTVPIIPIDTTVNIDTTSVFWLSEDIADQISSDTFLRLRSLIEQDSSYEWNFHKGNHFISFTVHRESGRPALVIHSNEKEFKYQFNGLMPVPGNWYMDSVRVFRHGPTYLRLLVGEKAVLFSQIAQDLEPYNINRHRFLATALVDRLCAISGEHHKQHYFMPTASTVAIGCYLCEADEEVLVFSRPGADLHFFRPATGGYNQVRLFNGDEYLIVPHGWGKTSAEEVAVEYDEKSFTINGHSFAIEPKITLGVHPGLVVRDLDIDPHAPASLYQLMSDHTPGKVTGSLVQRASYGKFGFKRHE
jgi:hypothetical protein